MPVGNDTTAYRRHLRHLTREGKTYFVTFRTRGRLQLEASARDAVLSACIELHPILCWLECMTVMPDHVHAIFTPREIRLADLTKRFKGRSSHRANRVMKRRGPLWQHESFDHIVRAAD